MALYVLPRIATILDRYDTVLAAELHTLTARLETAVMLQWNGRWFTRAILRDLADRPVPIADDWINLEAQPWAMISGVAARMDIHGVQARLVDNIGRLLDDPSPIGAPLSERGMVWPAISQLLTWGYGRSRPDLAWRSLKRNSFAAHAKTFPQWWHGIWSGPDGSYAVDATPAGAPWSSPVTPMTDFPVMNTNPDAMALLGLLRVCGIEPAPDGDGLLIAPQSPPDSFTLDLPLIRMDVNYEGMNVEYRPMTTGNMVLHLRVPPGKRLLSATCKGQPVTAAQGADMVFPLSFNAGEKVTIDLRWI